MMATFSNKYQVRFLKFSRLLQGKLIICIYILNTYILWILWIRNNDKVNEDATVYNIKRNIYNKLGSKINIALVVYVYSTIFICTNIKNIYWDAR